MSVDSRDDYYQKAYGSEDITSGLRNWALNTIKRYYLMNKKKVSE